MKRYAFLTRGARELFLRRDGHGAGHSFEEAFTADSSMAALQWLKGSSWPRQEVILIELDISCKRIG